MICKLRLFVAICGVFVLSGTPGAHAANLDYTVDVDSDVVVTGSPRLTLTIGADTQYAVYDAGASTPTSLVFRYGVQAGDLDADGVTVGSSIDLNGGTIRDAGGNDLPLSYTAPVTPNVRVQTYQPTFTTDPITENNETAAAFEIAKAPNGANFDYTITSSGGAGSVTGSGTIGADPHAVTGVNVSSLPYGTLTVSVTVTNASGTGAARTDDVGGNFTGALDSLNAQAAYSVRKLRTAYTGNALQVRRTSDDTTSDIGFTFAGNLNTAALATFCGASNCFVSRWYNQIAASPDAIAPIVANQPQIYTGGAPGSVIQQSGRPALRWGANNMLGVTGLTWDAYTISTVMTHNNVAQVKVLAMKRNGTGGGSDFFWFTYTGDRIFWDQADSAGGRFDTGFLPSTGTRYIYTLVRPLNGSNRTQYVNGVVRGSTATNNNENNTQVLYIGNDNADQSRSVSAQIGEFIVFTSALDGASRMALEDSQGSYYP